MFKEGLQNFFKDYAERKGIFKDKNSLQSNFIPEFLIHREVQIQQLAQILAPCIRKEKPSNILIYGKTGTGKTVTVQHVTKSMKIVADEKNIPLIFLYLNCKLKKVADTEYRLIAQLARDLGQQIPPTGLPTDEVYNFFYKALDASGKIVLLVLDEIDQLAGSTSDQILYNLTRMNSELKSSQISFVGISNNLSFTNTLDPRVKSSLSQEEIVFPPYNALQLQDILRDRAKLSFSEGIIDDGVIEKCAAYAAREHGDARRALELLRVAGELAERGNSQKILVEHIDNAEEKIDHDTITEIVGSQPLQHQLTLHSLLTLCGQTAEPVFTGEIYDVYNKLCEQQGIRPLTQRRISDILGEFDMLGIIRAKVISKGRYGRTREIRPCVPLATELQIRKTLHDALSME
ncbi:orc1/cdc6 family replication initiation protein [Candidatus Woesearchaeota archaeon]|nr:orc1/cdc6 family replication initiation protein [Candidatus Woesearchaeota archaeon]